QTGNAHNRPPASSLTIVNRWIFEKYDGVRGFWNPEQKAFYYRLGNRFAMPQEIINAMPDDIFLDGELWLGLPLSLYLFRCLFSKSKLSCRFGVDNFQEASKIPQ